ncbi:uncharacterized protein TNCV_141451 [Trichonephila clavipes]|nr:uncharacterized protein TNCV_141451 [Trichonephila clavipes]
MSFLGKGKKANLIKLAIELGEFESDGEELNIIELRSKILTNDAYKEDPEFVKCIFGGIIANRKDAEKEQKDQTLHEFVLQKIRLQNETQRVVGPQTLTQAKIELQKSLQAFNPEVDNVDLFLLLFERQRKLLDLEILADKLETFDNIRRSLPRGPRRHVKASETVNDGRQISSRKPDHFTKREYFHPVPNERSSLR